MNIIKTDIEGVLMIEPNLFRDDRGYFLESFNEREFNDKISPILGHKINFCQDNESMSFYGVLRGLHFQRPPYSQSKLVRCVKGRVLDVVVDIRKGSPTYGKYVSAELTEDNHLQFFIPRGFAHGFAVLSETAFFNISVMNSTIRKQMVVSLSSMTPLVSIGRFLQRMLISLRKIRSICY